MEQTFDPGEIAVGFHPAGYRIDKTAAPIDWYTQWQILPGSRWCDPKPVPFDSLPRQGWIKKDRFDWEKSRAVKEACLT